MFGLSIAKILVIVGIILALWRGMKMLKTFRDAADRYNRLAAERERRRGEQQVGSATELFECPKCGTFVPNGTICPSRERCLLKRA
jgi:ribosomal protein L32